MTSSGPPYGVSGVFAGYDEPTSHFLIRLEAVQRAFATALDGMGPGEIVVLDICAGVGRAVLPVLASHARGRDVRAYLVELDSRSASIARDTIRTMGLPSVAVVEADAGLAETYVGLERADVVILSGVLPNISPTDRQRIVSFLRQVCAPGATLIWSIGDRLDRTRVHRVRRRVLRAGFALTALHRVGRWAWNGGKHEVGVATMIGEPEPLVPVPGARLFTFRPLWPGRHPHIVALIRPAWRFLRRSQRRRGTPRVDEPPTGENIRRPGRNRAPDFLS